MNKSHYVIWQENLRDTKNTLDCVQNNWDFVKFDDFINKSLFLFCDNFQTKSRIKQQTISNLSQFKSLLLHIRFHVIFYLSKKSKIIFQYSTNGDMEGKVVKLQIKIHSKYVHCHANFLIIFKLFDHLKYILTNSCMLFSLKLPI